MTPNKYFHILQRCVIFMRPVRGCVICWVYQLYKFINVMNACYNTATYILLHFGFRSCLTVVMSAEIIRAVLRVEYRRTLLFLFFIFRFISQFYSNGDFCEESKTLRTVEVKLKYVYSYVVWYFLYAMFIFSLLRYASYCFYGF